MESLHAKPSPTLCGPVDSSSQVSVPGDSPGKVTGVGCHALLQGILPTQGLSPGPSCLPFGRQVLCHLGAQCRALCVCVWCLVVSSSLRPHPPGSSILWILQAKLLEWVAMAFFRDLPNPGIDLRFPTLQADSLPAESSGEPKNTEVSSLSILQWIFPTQESNPGLLHCRQIF